MQSVILAGLPDAEWDYIPDGGWMEVFLAGSHGRGGVVEPLGDDLEISVHPETNLPLSIIIPGFRAYWAGRRTRRQRSPMRLSTMLWHGST